MAYETIVLERCIFFRVGFSEACLINLCGTQLGTKPTTNVIYTGVYNLQNKYIPIKPSRAG